MISNIILFPILVFFVAAGFCFLFHSPKKAIIPSCLVCSISYLCYMLADNVVESSIIASFVGALVLGFTCDISARIFKEAAIVFIAPAMIPFVPGTKLYSTVVALLDQNYIEAASLGSETIFIAGALALGLVVSGSISNIIILIYRSIKKPTRKE